MLIRWRGTFPLPFSTMTFTRFKSHLLLISLAVFSLALLSFSCSEKPLSENAKLSIEPAEADFGSIPADDPIAFHDVSLTAKNLGKEPLVVDDIELPEGFSYAIIPRERIRGGERAMLKITMDIRQFSGPVSQVAYVLSNDPAQPRTPIKLVAKVVGERTGAKPAVANAPDISYDHKTVDFGTIGRSQMIEHTFPLRNLGRKPLKIYSIETKCLCLTATPSAWEVPPGGSAEIVARLEAYKYEGKTPFKSLEIVTNDPDEPVTYLTVAAEIIDEAVLEPEVVLMPNVQLGKPASAEAKLIQGGRKELVITDIATSSPNISVTTSPLEGKQKGYLLTIVVGPDMPVGKFNEVVKIYTNYENLSKLGAITGKKSGFYKDYSRLQLPVKGTVTGAVSVSPQQINFGSCAPGTPVHRKLIVSSTASTFDIESVSLPDPSFRVSHSPVEPGKKYEVIVEFLPEPPERQIEDKLVIATTSTRLVVPIFATVKSDS